jgi:uncharacterized protein
MRPGGRSNAAISLELGETETSEPDTSPPEQGRPVARFEARPMIRGLVESGLRGAAGAGEALLAPLGARSRSFRQEVVLTETVHRPYRLPDRPWFMAQSWEDLLFAHWPVPAEELRRVVPPGIPIDTYDGRAWIAITPFRVGAVRLRGLPHLPGVTSFPETNVRTYATIGERPGIYFLSLDAASAVAVSAARRSYRLPYFQARMSARRAGDWIEYSSTRASPDGPAAELRARYRPTGRRFEAEEGSLEQFLVERYCLYTLDEQRRVCRADIHHPPWPLQPAEAEFQLNTMAEPFGVCLRGDPLLHFSRREDVLIWTLERQPASTAAGRSAYSRKKRPQTRM